MQAMTSIQDLMTLTLGDLHATEQRQLQALPMIMQSVQSQELRDAFSQHEQETRTHVQRLDQIFGKLGQQPPQVDNPVLDAMVNWATELMGAAGNPAVKDAALICEAQKFEHMEMAGYGTAAAIAKQMGDQETARILSQTLQEEKASDERLSRIAESTSNPQATQQGA